MLKGLIVLGCLLRVNALEGKNGVGRLPALGWNSWNAFKCDINEAKFLTAAQRMVDLGLKDAGYNYVNIDDCWSVKNGRDPRTNQLQPDTSRFPQGIAGTANKIHNMGLKIGIYSSAGTLTCAGFPASIGHEDIDAKSFSDWGIDYLKYDNCNVPAQWADECNWCVPDPSYTKGLVNGTCHGVPGNWCPDGYDFGRSKTAQRFRIMGEALAKQSRPILYSLCEWGFANVKQWGASVAQSWRMSDDINPSWDRIMLNFNQNSFYMNSVDFYAHSDPDMLEVGNGGLTYEENRSHFALWAAMKSPLLIGTDLARIPDNIVAILKNKYLLAFNQDDKYGKPAKPYKWGTNPNWTFDPKHPAEYWAGMSKQGMLVLGFNSGTSKAVRQFRWNEVPGTLPSTAYRVIEAWSGQDKGCHAGGVDVTVGPHDTAVLLLAGRCSQSRARRDIAMIDISVEHSKSD